MLRVIPMNQGEFEAYLKIAVAEYAQAHTKAGDCEPEKALELAQKDYRELLPQGLQSPNQFLFSGVDDSSGTGKPVGMIWFGVKEKPDRKAAFIYDFRIDAEHQRRGYGEEVLLRCEELAKDMGISRISLNVFGFNVGARKLYEKVGYRIVSIAMTKEW